MCILLAYRFIHKCKYGFSFSYARPSNSLPGFRHWSNTRESALAEALHDPQRLCQMATRKSASQYLEENDRRRTCRLCGVWLPVKAAGWMQQCGMMPCQNGLPVSSLIFFEILRIFQGCYVVNEMQLETRKI